MYKVSVAFLERIEKHLAKVKVETIAYAELSDKVENENEALLKILHEEFQIEKSK